MLSTGMSTWIREHKEVELELLEDRKKTVLFNWLICLMETSFECVSPR